MKTVRQNAVKTYGNLLAGIAVPLVLTAIGWPFRAILTPSNILMFYLLGVFFVAIRFGFWPSVLASLTNATAFAYFFAPPIFSLAISEPENLAGLGVTMLVGVVTSNLAENVRHQADMAERREQRASALYQLSKELAEARLQSEIIEIGVRHIHTQFDAHNTILFPDSDGHLCYPDQAPLAISLRGSNLSVARWVFDHGHIAGNHMKSFAEEAAVYMPLKGSTGLIGVLVLDPTNLHQAQIPELRQLLDTFVNQIVQTLERSHLAEQAKGVTLKMQAETLRNSLLSSISHDLRTPLATIVGAASTLESDEEQLSENTRRKLVRAINQEAQRMSDLTIKILEMARLEAGEVQLNLQWYEPEEIIGSALRILDKKLKGRDVHVNIQNSQTLIHVDAVLLQQVIVNLLDNAHKYSPAELPLDISVESTPIGLSIKVADSGPGIPLPLQQQIFDKFFQIHAESAQSGVGLGLSICRAIVEAHGGEIVVSNRSEGGAVFETYLPVHECPPPIDLEEPRTML